MAAGDGGFAQAFQIVSLFGMLFIAYSHNKREVTRVFNVSNPAINTFLFFSFYALLSATWAFYASVLCFSKRTEFYFNGFGILVVKYA